MVLRRTLFTIGTVLLSWYLVFGFPHLDSIDLTTELLAKPTSTFVADLEDVDNLKPEQPKSHPTAYVRCMKDSGEVSEPTALPAPVDLKQHAVAPQYDLLLVFRV